MRGSTDSAPSGKSFNVLGNKLRAVPSTSDVDDLVHALSGSIHGVRTPSEALVQWGWTLEVRPTGYEDSPIESLLIPRDHGGFHVVVDQRRRPSKARVEWLIAHEIAHSLFFLLNSPPRRTVRWTPEEETFCDDLADGWMGSEDRGVEAEVSSQIAS